VRLEPRTEEIVGSPAAARAAGTDGAALRASSRYPQGHPSELDAAAHADGASRPNRSSTSLIHITTGRDGFVRPVRCGTIALVDLHPDVAIGLSAAELRILRGGLVLPVVRIQRGPCELAACAAAGAAHGLLGAVVTEGLLIAEMRLAGHVSAQIYGPEDLVNGDHEPNGSLATAQVLHAPVATSLALLDDRFVAALRQWPRLAARFFVQAMRQADRAGEHQAICQLTRVEDRLLALFWYLADRWGRVRTDAVVIEVPLTHETIGRLVGARRPTVTLGLRQLARQGLLRRERDGRWLLATDSVTRVNTEPGGNGRYPSPVGVAS
jgi:CRP/FNR family cyclic AMP-dependent transcriptional regulator